MDNNRIKEIRNNPYFRNGLILLIGIFLGWLLFSSGIERFIIAYSFIRRNPQS